MSDRKPAPAPSVAGPALLPCPWGCSDPAKPPELETYGSEGDWLYVRCSDCGAKGPLTVRSESEAIAAWNDRRTPTNPTPPVEAEARGRRAGLLEGAAWCANYEKALIRHQRGEGQPGASLASISLGQAAAALRALAAAPQGVGDGAVAARVVRGIGNSTLSPDSFAAMLGALDSIAMTSSEDVSRIRAYARRVLERIPERPDWMHPEKPDALTTTEREGGAPEVQPGDAGRGRTAEEPATPPTPKEPGSRESEKP